MKSIDYSRAVVTTLLIVAALGGGQIAAAAGGQVIEFTQTGCQFIESEGGKELGYRTTRAADCEAINERTAEQRLQQAQPLRLKPGKYTFRVANRDVPYQLGFWLRAASLIDRVRLPSVSGGGLVTGKSRDYEIELKPGEYVYSCPLNPTPDYRLIVEG
ncbi:MAG: hypothetical protein DWQ09_02735 [Proteobacteria bacterium]|nr:MAG: hypothetical protein DWQ09_02735 [Pseudomonadota bacterium]QKK10935.1 MAG: hypothetical protein HND59_04345 [Pseudomonadota bacterium]